MIPTERQREQVLLQSEAHRHENYSLDLDLGEGLVLRDFAVRKGVLRPELMLSLPFARYLVERRETYAGKRVAVVGCGTGIDVLAVAPWAKEVYASDVDLACCENTRANVLRARVSNVHVRAAYLLDGAKDAECVVFNHPFFAGLEMEGPGSMIGEPRLLEKFLRQASRLPSLERVVMPFYHVAPRENDPGYQAPLHSYDVVRRISFENREGLQRGMVSFYELCPEEVTEVTILPAQPNMRR